MVTIRAASAADTADAAALLHDHVEWVRIAAGIDPLAEQPTLADELERTGEVYGTPDRTLLLARWGAVAVGTIAVRHHHDGSAELKRMYVRPVARGRGVADALVSAALDHAAAQGCRVAWLETLRGVMDRAIAVYERHGFVARPDLGHTLAVDGVVVMARPLVPAGEEVAC
jgi:GNAT superfamily N-acetyltransferase